MFVVVLLCTNAAFLLCQPLLTLYSIVSDKLLELMGVGLTMKVFLPGLVALNSSLEST